MDKKEYNKKLVEKYPFLLPRNVFTDKLDSDYDYSYVLGIGEIPTGWNKLFLQMCEDLKKQLIKDNQLESFRFTQIKEKYNRLECYNNGCSPAAHHIIDKYGQMSKYVCTICGKPAYYETNGYIQSFCDQCWKDRARHIPGEFIHLKTSYRVIGFSKNKKTYHQYSFLREWNRYLKNFK